MYGIIQCRGGDKSHCETVKEEAMKRNTRKTQLRYVAT